MTFFNGPQHMEVPMLDNQQKLINISPVADTRYSSENLQGAIDNRGWRERERESEKSMLAVQLDDDHDIQVSVFEVSIGFLSFLSFFFKFKMFICDILTMYPLTCLSVVCGIEH